MKKPVCPFCGWDVDHPDYDDHMVPCYHCREYVVAVEEESLLTDPDVDAEVESEMNADNLQDEYESDSTNYGYDDDSRAHAFPLDKEIF